MLHTIGDRAIHTALDACAVADRTNASGGVGQLASRLLLSVAGGRDTCGAKGF